ncbi:hypothetical protein Glove_217g247 [Diversispora epigaea]|uniref:Uncharacterized protein n=1 Tax=Diversispora epigaea TaxID=1348612 RepID=A0A397IH46_9GLOM|nr:hypothetical protein Glove_217g247 [Diversispora epigaea]
MSLEFFDWLSQNFIELLNVNDDYDVIIEVKNLSVCYDTEFELEESTNQLGFLIETKAFIDYFIKWGIAQNFLMLKGTFTTMSPSLKTSNTVAVMKVRGIFRHYFPLAWENKSNSKNGK